MELGKAILKCRRFLGKNEFSSIQLLSKAGEYSPRLVARNTYAEIQISLDLDVPDIALDGVHAAQVVRAEKDAVFKVQGDTPFWGNTKVVKGSRFLPQNLPWKFSSFHNCDQVLRATHASDAKDTGFMGCIHLCPDVVEAANRWRVVRCFADFPVEDPIVFRTEVTRWWSKSFGTAELSVLPEHVAFRFDDTLVHTRRQTLSFGKCCEALPVSDQGFINVVVNTEQFLEHALHIKKVARKPKLTHLQLKGGRVSIFGGLFVGDLSLVAGPETLDMEGVTVNSDWLVEALQECHTENVVLGFGAVLVRLESGNYREGLWVIDMDK